jgi:hypothetical protein
MKMQRHTGHKYIHYMNVYMHVFARCHNANTRTQRPTESCPVSRSVPMSRWLFLKVYRKHVLNEHDMKNVCNHSLCPSHIADYTYVCYIFDHSNINPKKPQSYRRVYICMLHIRLLFLISPSHIEEYTYVCYIFDYYS